DDWKLWLVVNPGTWLMPILMAVLVVALVVHAFVYSNDSYNPLHSEVEATQDIA
ncbi:MAG: light-harvesting protein, partial [Chromatiaceae bacterium]